MIVLRAIGNFFLRIGRWIKETAWVQPLLIVGGIFAIIFSIPYISSWVSSWFIGGSESNSFYSNYKVSLSGADKKESDANKLLEYMTAPLAEASESDKSKWGEKFYLVFVQEDCSGCESIYKGFEGLKNDWGKGEFAAPADYEGPKYDFKIHTIFVDSEEDIDNETKNLFKDYYFNECDALFEDLVADMQENNYAKKKGASYTNELQTITDIDKFATPTVFLFDPSNANNQLGVSEVLFTVPGKDGKSGAINISRTLYDCWYTLGDFAANS